MVEELLNNYCARNRNPFELFANRGNIDRLVEAIGIPEARQGDLFYFRLTPDELVEEMRERYERNRLYRTWKQVIDGKSRSLAVPSECLQEFLQRYILPLIKRRENHPQSHGGVESSGWTPKRSLETHLPLRSVLSFDLASAFNNVGITHVFDFFYDLFSNCDEPDRSDFAGFASTITTVTYDDKRSLPQGASHSMPLFNRILREFDGRLDESAQGIGSTYTRWVDDITISSREEKDIEDFFGAVVLTSQFFPVARGKIFFQRSTQPIYLLGHIIERGKVYKNSKEDREKNKVQPLDYEEWFGREEKRYVSWQ